MTYILWLKPFIWPSTLLWLCKCFISNILSSVTFCLLKLIRCDTRTAFLWLNFLSKLYKYLSTSNKKPIVDHTLLISHYGVITKGLPSNINFYWFYVIASKSKWALKRQINPLLILWNKTFSQNLPETRFYYTYISYYVCMFHRYP